MRKAAHSSDSKPTLLSENEPPAFFASNRSGASDFIILVDHASARIPERLGSLGLAVAELRRHIAWDIGALGVATRVAAALDAPLVAQNYSRLVIDCNRDPQVPSSIPSLSEASEIPGNQQLSEADKAARRAEIFQPYHDHIRGLIDERIAAGKACIIVAQHTMTDVFNGIHRPMHAAILYNRDRRFAGRVLDSLRSEAGLTVADNEPYFVSDATDYSIPVHAEARALPHVEIEIRQDLVSDATGQARWAERIVRALQDAQRSSCRADLRDHGNAFPKDLRR